MAGLKTQHAVKHDALTNFVIAVLDEFGIEFDEDPEHSLVNLKRSQVRPAKEVAPRETVQETRAKIQSGRRLPPFVVTQDDELVDGNTRVEALKQEKRTTGYALILRKTAAELGRTDITILGHRLNEHGKRLSAEVKEHAVRELLAEGATTERIAQHLSVMPGEVSAIKAIVNGERRLSESGVQPNGFKKAHLKTLGRSDLLAEPFREVATLASDAGLSAGDLGDLIKRVKVMPSEGEQLELLKTEKTELREQITEHRRTGNGKPPASRRVKQSLAGFLAIVEHSDIAVLVERVPDKMAEQIAVLESAAAELSKLVDAQRTAIAAKDGVV